jgi:hypothetical protein
MRNPKFGIVLLSASAAWLVLRVATRTMSSSDVVEMMIPVWTLTIFGLPAFWAAVTVFTFMGFRFHGDAAHRYAWLGLLVASLALTASYAVAVAVLDRVHAVWWETVKFGGSHITLGRGAALTYIAVTVPLLIVCAVGQAKSNGRPLQRMLLLASLGMAGMASLTYLALAASPFVEWRA